MHIISATDPYHLPVELKFLGRQNSALSHLKDHELYASGRDALRSVSETLKNFKRIFLPSYICPGLPIFFNEFTDIKFYEFSLLSGKIKFLNGAPKKGDAILIINYFGCTNKKVWDAWAKKNPDIFRMENHTFAPFSEWAKTSDADLIFASLRKILPMPDGAYLKIKNVKARTLAQKPQSGIAPFAAEILSAMALKKLFKGSKTESYRKIFLRGEEKLFRKKNIDRISAYSFHLLERLNLEKYLRARFDSTQKILSQISNQFKCQTLGGENPYASFAPILAFETEAEMENARLKLLKIHSRPAIFWPNL